MEAEFFQSKGLHINMKDDVKKTVLRMIPYGLFVLTAADSEGNMAAGTINWITQASFQPPLVAVGVKTDSFVHQLIAKSGSFAVNVLGKEQQQVAYTFFKPVQREGDHIGGEPFKTDKTGAPLLENMPAFFECEVRGKVAQGDHTVFVGEVISVGLKDEIEGRPDEATLWLRDLGGDVFYGG
jgi:flavin reductase (DIM6/NTAB) family NADH-FMN oxidoreductase RutF